MKAWKILESVFDGVFKRIHHMDRYFFWRDRLPLSGETESFKFFDMSWVSSPLYVSVTWTTDSSGIHSDVSNESGEEWRVSNG